MQAEEAGDHATAAGHYERAFRLTAPAESGPRLLFLRSGVAARQRAFAGSSDARAHLCPARALLRDYLDLGTDAALPSKTDPSLAERDSLTKIESQLATARVDCTPASDVVPTPSDPVPDKPPPTTDAKPPPADPEPAPARAAKPAGPDPSPAAPPRLTRDLRISGGAALGIGAAGFAIMTAGIVLAADARKDGFDVCRTGKEACDFFTIEDIRTQGDRGNALLAAGATIGGLGLVTGIVLLAVSKRAGRPRLAVSPTPTGLTLSGRF